MTEQSNVVYIDNKEYKSEDLSQEQIRLFNKTIKYQNRVQELRDSLEDAIILHKEFGDKLTTSLGNDETLTAMENTKES